MDYYSTVIDEQDLIKAAGQKIKDIGFVFYHIISWGKGNSRCCNKST